MKHVILGNGVAGITAAFTIKERRPEDSVTVISQETDYYYSRTALMYIAMDELRLQDTEPFERREYGDRGIELIRDNAVRIDPQSRNVVLASGRSLEYHRLLLATGALPQKPFRTTSDPDGIVYFVSYQDLENLIRLTREDQSNLKNGAVVGGGLIGIELCEVLLHKGYSVRYLIRSDHFFRAGLIKEEGRLVEEHMRKHGLDVHTGCSLEEIESENGRVTGVKTNTGRFPCSVLGIAAGVTANTETAAASGIETGRGIRCTPDLRTGTEHIFTAGDCAEIVNPDGRDNFIRTIWYSARDMGRVAGCNMTGGRDVYDPGPWYNSAKFFDLEYTVCGKIFPEGGDEENYLFIDRKTEQSVRAVHNGRQVLGFTMVGKRWDHSVLLEFIRENRSLEYFLNHYREAVFEPENTPLPLVKESRG
jgi:NADPH-dependent 2,4-dienoyl-CoA reductase/sulfur reductase-like enzyme